MRGVTHYFRLIAETEEADRKVRQAFIDIEQNIDMRFRHRYQYDPELKKQLAELKDLRERMEKTLAEEVKKPSSNSAWAIRLTASRASFRATQKSSGWKSSGNRPDG